MEASTTDAQRALLRHMLATLAYRAAKALRDVPAGFAEFRQGPATRTPCQIVAHMGDLMAWGERMAHGTPSWTAEGGSDWDTEVKRFFDLVAAFDRALATAPSEGLRPEPIIQGPIADALTHVGQLNLLRGAFGAPVRPESYARAEIEPGRVGLDQAAARYEFDGDASAKG